MRTYEVLVEAGQVLQFRRAVGELDAPLEPDGVAPPTFLMAADVFDPSTNAARAVDASGLAAPISRRAGAPAFMPSRASLPPPSAGRRAAHRDGAAGAALGEGRPARRRLVFTETITDFTDPSGELVASASFVSVGTERKPGE